MQIVSFTREVEKARISKKEREKQQRQLERQQRQQQQEVEAQQRQQQQQQIERDIALRAAAAGRLTRHVVKLLPEVIEAVSSPAAAAASDGATAADGIADGSLAAVDADIENADTAEAPAAAAKPKRGLKAEVLVLQQQLQNLQQLQQRKEAKEAEKASRRLAAEQQLEWQRQQQQQQRDLGGDDDDQFDDDEEDLDDEVHNLSDRMLSARRYSSRGARYSLRERQNGRAAVQDDDEDDEDGDLQSDEEEVSRSAAADIHHTCSAFGHIEEVCSFVHVHNLVAENSSPLTLRWHYQQRLVMDQQQYHAS